MRVRTLPDFILFLGLYECAIILLAAAGVALVVAFALAVLVIGLLPGWNHHLVPREIRERYRFRFNKPTFDSEYERWQHQAQNTVDWSTRGKALHSYAAQRSLPDEHPSYVIGGIGATAYYSNLFVYDYHGLVTPEVAHRTLEPHARLRSPGHDKKVSREYFLRHRPTILMANVVQHKDAQVIARAYTREVLTLRRSPPGRRLDDPYVVDLARVPTEDPADDPRYIITWTRFGAGTNPRDTQADLQRRLDRLRRGEHLPLPH